jgi:hypothetical protein
VAFGAANLARQATVIVSTAEIPAGIGIASWVGTALVVVIVVNAVAIALRRGGKSAPPGHALTPLWPLRRGDHDQRNPQGTPSSEALATSARRPAPATTSTKWAPWWLYLAGILGANALQRAVIADGGSPATRVVVALAVAVTLFITITALYRANVRRHHRHLTRPYQTH